MYVAKEYFITEQLVLVIAVVLSILAQHITYVAKDTDSFPNQVAKFIAVVIQIIIHRILFVVKDMFVPRMALKRHVVVITVTIQKHTYAAKVDKSNMEDHVNLTY